MRLSDGKGIGSLPVAEQLLQRKDVPGIERIRVDSQPGLRVAIMEKPDGTPFRKLYVGGHDKLASPDHAGELDKLLAL